jgi:5-methylcytosine-specific restriction enzyme A
VASGSYCDACGGGRKKDRDRRTAAQRGYGSAWQRASKAYLRAHPIAVDIYHHHVGPQLAEVVDHRIPHRGDMALFWDESNWQGLTKADHDRKTAEEDGGFGRPRLGRG